MTALVSTAAAVTLELDTKSIEDFDLDDLFADFFELTSISNYEPPTRDLTKSKPDDRFTDDYLD